MKITSHTLPTLETFRQNRAAREAVRARRGARFPAGRRVAWIFRDAKPMEIGAGTAEIRRRLIGCEMMGAI